MRFLLLSCLIAVAFTMLIVGSKSIEYAEALPGHSMTVTLTPDELVAKVSETGLGAVTFGGNVTVEKPQGVERVTVTLTGDCDKGWPISLSRQTIPFINPGSESFSFTVIVPPATPVSQAIGTVHAHAHSPIWDDDQTTTVRISVQQYFKMDLWTSSESFDGEVGGSVAGKLFINNSGNGEDTFSISIVEAPDAIKRWKLSQDTISIPVGFYDDIRFTLDISDDLNVGMDSMNIEVMLRVKSMAADERGLLYVKTYPVFIFFQGLEAQLYEEWPTYVGYGVVASLIIVPVVFILRRRKRRREPIPDLEIVEA
jgi:hypothetical protein